MAKFKMTVLTPEGTVETARLGSDTVANSGNLVDNDCDKFLKLVAESRYGLCAAGDPIEGQLLAVESASQDGYAIGSVKRNGRIAAICDGSQAAGTGSIAVGDYVVCGTVVAAGTDLTASTGPKVRKATYQPGTTAITNVNQIADAMKPVMHAWRIVSLGSAGAVGDTCVIERVGA